LKVSQCARKEKGMEMEIDPPLTDKGGRNKKQTKTYTHEIH
jgi:hypothetical protein